MLVLARTRVLLWNFRFLPSIGSTIDGSKKQSRCGCDHFLLWMNDIGSYAAFSACCILTRNICGTRTTSTRMLTAFRCSASTSCRTRGTTTKFRYINPWTHASVDCRVYCSVVEFHARLHISVKFSSQCALTRGMCDAGARQLPLQVHVDRELGPIIFPQSL